MEKNMKKNICVQLSHSVVQQKLIQYWKSTILQENLKKKTLHKSYIEIKPQLLKGKKILQYNSQNLKELLSYIKKQSNENKVNDKYKENVYIQAQKDSEFTFITLINTY